MPGGGLIWNLRCSAVCECSGRTNMGDTYVSHMNLYCSKRRLWDIMMRSPATVRRTWIFPKRTRYTKWVTTVWSRRFGNQLRGKFMCPVYDVNCMYTYVCVYICISIYTYIHMCACVCIYIYMWMYNQFKYIMFTDMYTYTHIYINMFHI